MADEKPKPDPTIPQPPVVNPGTINDVNNVTLSGTERVTVIPDLKVQPELKGIVTVEDQPGNQIESPIPAPGKAVEINRAPVPPLVQPIAQTQPSEPQEEKKVLTIDEARDMLRNKRQIIPLGEAHPDSKIAEAVVVDREEQRAA